MEVKNILIESYGVKYNYNSICLISSAGCNLKCKYCEISRSKDASNYASELQQKIKKAFEDGSYLQNVISTYQKLGQHFENITGINFWGQEPTLTFDSFRTRLEEWFETFPNINYMTFSTNGGTNPLLIYNLITDVDQTVNQDIMIDIQISYDGEWSCREQRMIDPEIIKQNYSHLIEKLNLIKLKHTTVRFIYHGVLNFELIHHLMNNNLVGEYLRDLDYITKWSNDLIFNPKCSVAPTTLALEQPYKASTEDGILFSNFLNLCLRENLKQNFYFANPINTLLRQLIGGINNNTKILLEDKWIQTLFNTIDNIRPPFETNLFDATFCSSYRTELKLMYDGTIVGCQNFLFNTVKEHLNEPNPVNYSVKENLIDKKMFINLTDENTTQEDLDKVFKKFENNETSFLTTYQSILNTILMLADCGQASQDYLYNREKLFKHGIMIAKYNSCFFNHLITTGSIFLEPTRLIRLLCNGALDVAEQWYDANNARVLKNEKEDFCK